MANKSKGLYFTSGIKEKSYKIPQKGLLGSVPKYSKNWKPKVSI
jgi:hypothetical protein